ncbi:sugar ABC transporter substrate-binding protein [Rugosimonospora acidiphila]|uniref:Sugar ABC transporter substrate-binding protein n=1 Tax=Rugosimonospora acidiphila TaxID=556531 RepID=A0ABP9RWA6_9ACTN
MLRTRSRWVVGGTGAFLSALVVLSGCATAKTTSTSNPGPCKIAFLLPENTTPRYEADDHPLFLAAVKAQDPSCQVLYFNAANSADKQQQQAESALSQGAKVLVLDAADTNSAANIVSEAKAQGVKTIAYDRAAGGPLAYQIGFDNVTVGEQQANSLVTAMKAAGHPNGKIVMLNGAPDATGAFFKQGAHNVLDKSGYTIAAEFDTTGWSPTTATTEMTQAISRVGKDQIVGVYSANDTLAGAAITAMQQAGMSPLPPITGLDATNEGLQRILLGTQTMTVYKAIKSETNLAAKIAIQMVNGQSPQGTSTKKNSTGDTVQTQDLPPVAVTAANVKSTVVADGFISAKALCAGDVATACAKDGIS